jgi:hypothetical protein
MRRAYSMRMIAGGLLLPVMRTGVAADPTRLHASRKDLAFVEARFEALRRALGAS